MQNFVRQALERGVIEMVPEEERTVKKLYLVQVTDHPWLADGVAFDWRPLHQSLKASGAAWALPDSPPAADSNSLITTIEIVKPWETCKLDAHASNMSCFTAVDDQHVQRLYRFVRGPAGQRSVRDDAQRLVRSVAEQLSRGGLMAQAQLSTIIVFGKASDVDGLLTQTGQAYRALRQAGLTIDASRSNLEPRAAVFYGRGQWSTLDHASLRTADLLAAFVTDAFYCWLDDRHVWFCDSPVPPSIDAIDASFARFLDVLAAKRAALNICSDLLLSVEDHEELKKLCAPMLTARACPRPGPQRWTVLELRQFIKMMGMYDD